MKKTALHERHEFLHLRQVIEWAGEEYADKWAYSFRQGGGDKSITRISFGQLRGDVRALACTLAEMGCAGRNCAVVGKLSYEWVLTYFAVQSIGGVLVPLDPEWHAEDLADTAKKANASFLFCDEDIAGKAEIIALTAALEAPPVYMQAKQNERNLEMLVAMGKPKYRKDPALYREAPIDPRAMSLLVFTSGTTGKGKGVMLSQEAILSNVCAAIPYIDYSEKTLGVLPPHHTYGSSVLVLGHVIIGAEVYISAGLRHITKELKEQKPGHLILVPLYLETFYRRILANIKEQGKEKIFFRMMKASNALRRVGIDRRKEFFRSVRAAFGGELKTVISGGAPINPEILAFFDALGIETLNGYGITECAPLIAFTPSHRVVVGSVGDPIDIDTVVIDSPNEDWEGEILVKGPNVMLGYYGDPEATADAIDRDGFFHTGDYGRIDEDGTLFITGRKKNLIILSNGKNVYPEEIENELISIPGLLEIVVYEGQSRRGQAHNAIVAEIFPDKDFCEKNGITDAAAYFKPFIDEYNRGAVAYKKIAQLKIRHDEFPKNTLRKIMRFKIDTTIS